uniref:Toll-interacting protein n=2 Tax=Clytia hemisphaerica TaxID=252671 RepID=A0A7M5WK70_9CNID
MLQQQQAMGFGGFHQSAVGAINLTIVQARLAKNYGMTRMDPFCRIRLGVMVFETPTAYNGSKTPRWNKTIQSQLPPGVTEFYIEIYDERTFQMDEKVAWGMIKIKPEVLEGQTDDEWHALTGKQGDGKEGMVQIIMQYKKGAAPMMMNPMIGGAPVLIQQPPNIYGGGMVYGVPPMVYQQPMVAPQPQMVRPPYAQPPQQTQQTQQQFMQPHIPDSSLGQINEKDLKALKEMCPGLDDEIIKSVYQSSGENLDRAAAQLLEMSAS